MKYQVAIAPHEPYHGPAEVDEAVRPVAPSRRSSRVIGIAVAVFAGIVGFGYTSRAWAPPVGIDRGADAAALGPAEAQASAAATEPGGAETPWGTGTVAGAVGTRGVADSAAVGDSAADPRRVTVAASGMSVSWTLTPDKGGAVLFVEGTVDPTIGVVTVVAERAGRAVASATVAAGLEDERGGTDGRARGEARFVASLSIPGRLPETGLRLAVEWNDPSTAAGGAVRWPLAVTPADAEPVGLQPTPGRHQR